MKKFSFHISILKSSKIKNWNENSRVYKEIKNKKLAKNQIKKLEKK